MSSGFLIILTVLPGCSQLIYLSLGLPPPPQPSVPHSASHPHPSPTPVSHPPLPESHPPRPVLSLLLSMGRNLSSREVWPNLSLHPGADCDLCGSPSVPWMLAQTWEAEFARKQLLCVTQSQEPGHRATSAPCHRCPFCKPPGPAPALVLPGPPAGPAMNIDGTAFVTRVPLGPLQSGRSRDLPGFVVCQDMRRRQMDTLLQTSVRPGTAQRSPGCFQYHTLASGPVFNPIYQGLGLFFYQSNALSTLSTWTSGRTSKFFYLLKYLIV